MSEREQVTLIGLCFADPSVPWLDRGTAEKNLAEKCGWDLWIIPTVVRGQPATMEARCRGELAVHKMVENEGFAISLASSGFRISYGGAVFGRSSDAMVAAEAMMVTCQDWQSCQTRGFSHAQREALRNITSDAEQRGEILLDRVYPA